MKMQNKSGWVSGEGGGGYRLKLLWKCQKNRGRGSSGCDYIRAGGGVRWVDAYQE